MRVIAGQFRSRPLLAPPGLDTRPTADRLRETLFNVLTNGAVNRVAGKAFLDLYAGSGAVGIEALSRGAAQVVFVESGPAALATLRKNLEALKIRTGFSAEKRSAASYLRRETRAFDLVFLDPPYEASEEYTETLGLLGGDCSTRLVPDGLVVAEHRRQTPLAESYGRLVRMRVLEQGDASLSFYTISKPD